MSSVNKPAASAAGTSSARSTAVATPALATARARGAGRAPGVAAGAAGGSGASSTFSRDLSAAPRLVQHKNEAKLFYRYLSIVYDDVVNGWHWNDDMRVEALRPADLRAGQKVRVGRTRGPRASGRGDGRTDGARARARAFSSLSLR
jgi:hypothetical protein